MKILIIAMLLTFAIGGNAQSGVGGGGQSNVSGGGLVQTFPGVPTGTCGANALAVNTTNGNLYSCNNGTWTLVSGGGGSPAFSAITSGTNTTAAMVVGSGASLNTTGTGTIGGTTTGVFTNAAMNDNFLFTTNGGVSPCNSLDTLNFGGSTFKLTDGVASVLCVPSSGVTNGFSNAFGAYTKVTNTNATGTFGWVGGVGYYAQSWCTVGTNCHVWGANFSAGDTAANGGASVIGNEYDLTINNTTATGAGTLYSFRGNGQPTLNNFPAVTIQAPAGTASFTAGYVCQDGSLANTNNFNCLQVGQQTTGLNSNSHAIQIFASDGSAQFNGQLSLNQNHYMFLGGLPVINYGSNTNATYGGGFGITLKATAALTLGQLVKIDTANADSVVVCTTADTICHGFVVGANTGSSCGVGSTLCPVLTTPGSLAKGILGTGTCAIGNFVIVDTTTNGRLKCTASQPAVGATIGLALSAQAVVGNTVDVLTKFQ